VTGKAVSMPEHGWRYAPEQMEKLLADGRIRFGTDESTRPTYKRYLTDAEDEIPYSVFYVDGRGASGRLKSLLGRTVFENPKDELVLRKLVEFASGKDDIVLDFFAGSGTTAHSVFLQNIKDGGSRRFILVQLPEPTPDESTARSSGFPTIASLARHRVSLAGQRVIELSAKEPEGGRTSLDIGFRAYSLSDTNFVKWQVSSDVDLTVLEQHLEGLRESANDDSTADALLTEILLKQGSSLTEKIEPVEIAGLELRSVNDGLVLAYLDEHTKPTLEQLRAVADQQPARIIVLEDAFRGDDELKTNLAQLCASRGIELWTA
jgi:adenine-specific DNA-methyltransferase